MNQEGRDKYSVWFLPAGKASKVIFWPIPGLKGQPLTAIGSQQRGPQFSHPQYPLWEHIRVSRHFQSLSVFDSDLSNSSRQTDVTVTTSTDSFYDHMLEIGCCIYIYIHVANSQVTWHTNPLTPSSAFEGRACLLPVAMDSGDADFSVPVLLGNAEIQKIGPFFLVFFYNLAVFCFAYGRRFFANEATAGKVRIHFCFSDCLQPHR